MKFLRLACAAALLPLSSVAASATETPCTVRVSMSDGAELLTDVYRVDGPGAHPVVLLRTPYGRGGYDEYAEQFNARGYTLVVQAVRGTDGSEGRFVPFAGEGDDGEDTLAWLREQAWADGNVLLFGDSYAAYAALRIAERGPPGVKALFLASPFHAIERMLYPGGAFHLALNVPWNMLSLGLFDPDAEWEAIFASLPVTEMIRTEAGAVHPGWRETMAFFGGTYPEADPRLAALDADPAAVRAPVFILTGWHDFVVSQSIGSYEVLADRDGVAPARLVIGPWYHDQADWGGTVVGDVDFGPQASFGWERKLTLATGWFDRWIEPSRAEVPETAEPPDVRYFLMGADRWVEADGWPPPDMEERTWYLAGTGDPSATEPSTDGLRREPPAASRADRFVYDPTDPVPTVGGVNVHFFPDNVGPLDQRSVEARADVLTYTSSPLKRDVDVVGPVRTLLYVSADAPDTDLTAKLVVVRPDGYARIVQEGIQRLRFREDRATPTLLSPGEVVPVRINLGPTALRVPAGHRLRLEISGGSFPKYDRNPNTGENPLTATEFRPVRITIHSGPDTPSHVVVPTAP